MRAAGSALGPAARPPTSNHRSYWPKEPLRVLSLLLAVDAYLRIASCYVWPAGTGPMPMRCPGGSVQIDRLPRLIAGQFG